MIKVKNRTLNKEKDYETVFDAVVGWVKEFGADDNTIIFMDEKEWFEPHIYLPDMGKKLSFIFEHPSTFVSRLFARMILW